MIIMLINVKNMEYSEAVFGIRFSSKLIMLERREVAELSKKIVSVFPTASRFTETHCQFTNNKQCIANIYLDRISISMSLGNETVDCDMFFESLNIDLPIQEFIKKAKNHYYDNVFNFLRSVE
jgi:hypothetical protein